MKKGFTLIELLVVVLIIGILAAVAMPQYQKAVQKSRAAEAMIILKKMQTNYQLMIYADSTDDLEMVFEGIDLPAVANVGLGARQGKHYCYALAYGFIAAPGDCSAVDSADYYLAMDVPGGTAVAERFCEGNNEKGIAFCKSLGTKKINDSVWEF